MLSRDVMKAAEHSQRLYGTNGQPYFVGDEGCLCVREMSAHILAHREDYDADGMPLEVDEGFAKSLGFEGPADEGGFFWRKIPGCKVGVDCTPQYPSLMFVDADGDQTIFPAPKTRPQLRALIQSLRGS